MINQTYAVVDLETTGQSKSKDRIIQIAIVLIENGQVTKQFSSFVNPEIPIPGFIQELTNISVLDVENAPTFNEIAQQVYTFIEGAIFVAHNVAFDFSFLQAELNRAQMPKLYCKQIDTLELCKILFPTSDSYQLGELAKDLNIELENAHRADDDALATAKLLQKCWEKTLQLPLVTLERIHKYSFHLKSDISQIIFDAIRQKRAQIEGHYAAVYYRGIALKPIEELYKPAMLRSEYPVTANEKLQFIQRSIAKAEKRDAQFKMMDNVWTALQEEQEIAIEASTGIGKSLGYLLPAIHYSDAIRKPVVVSTHTAHLMEDRKSVV